MTDLGANAVALVVIVALATATLAVVAVLAATARRAEIAARRAALARAAELSPIAFLFEDEMVTDATPAGLALLDAAPDGASDWARLAGLLRHRFPGLDAAMGGLAAEGRIDLAATGGAERLRADWLGGRVRVALTDGDLPTGDQISADRLARAALEGELQALRSMSDASPVPAWIEDGGEIVWANGAYFSLAQEIAGPDQPVSWPPPRLFRLAPGEPGETPVRTPVELGDGQVRWFDCHGGRDRSLPLRHALPADAAVRAEEQLREFVQVLGKTFATLPIGLAVFDRARRLVLFNPALIDLTLLDVGFLSARPSLGAFLDQLRDRRRMPEPRDYRSWKQRMQALETAASDGFGQETWTLPTGQTYRVTGRPHPDGAIAFLIEDISSEVSLTRRFRAEVELGHKVLDTLTDAVAVFTPTATLALTNAAYADLWGTDPRETLAEIALIDALRHWEGTAGANPGWRRLATLITGRGDRTAAALTVPGPGGAVLDVRLRPLQGGGTVVSFRPVPASAADPDGPYPGGDARPALPGRAGCVAAQ